MEETKEKDKTTSVVYISDNDNMFIAPEGISEEERKRLSLEVDRDLLKKKKQTRLNDNSPYSANRSK